MQLLKQVCFFMSATYSLKYLMTEFCVSTQLEFAVNQGLKPHLKVHLLSKKPAGKDECDSPTIVETSLMEMEDRTGSSR